MTAMKVYMREGHAEVSEYIARLVLVSEVHDSSMAVDLVTSID